MTLDKIDVRSLQRARRAWTARALPLLSLGLQTALKAIIVVAVSGARYSGLDARGRREPFSPNLTTVISTEVGAQATTQWRDPEGAIVTRLRQRILPML